MKKIDKSDIEAKQKFKEYLLGSGSFVDVQIVKSPADIIAKKHNDPKPYYFEIKKTDIENRKNKNNYFGAATLTEWACAWENESRFKFVVAYKNNQDWNFKEYTPSEFVQFCDIPPFKVYFNIPLDENKIRKTRENNKKIIPSKEIIFQMKTFFSNFKIDNKDDGGTNTN